MSRTSACAPARRRPEFPGRRRTSWVPSPRGWTTSGCAPAGRRPSRCARRARVATTRSKECRPRSQVSSTPGPTERSRRRAPACSLASWRHTPASHTACVPHSARATTWTWGQALVPRPPPGRPNARALAGVSGTSHFVPSSAIRRHRPRNAPGVARVARGRQTALNRAANGRAPRRARAWHSAPGLTRQASGCAHRHRSPLTSRAATCPRQAAAYRFMAIQKKTVAAAGSLRTRRSRTPQASTTASTAAGVTTAASASKENSGGAAAGG